MNAQLIARIQKQVAHAKRMKEQKLTKKRRKAISGMTNVDQKVDYARFLEEVPNLKLIRR